MFDTLSDRLTSVLSNLRGKGRLSEADIDATAREIRIALLEADVALPVVRTFIAGIKERAKGAEVSQALNPAQQVVKIVNEELVGVLGGETRRVNLAKNPPTVIMLAGLQGAGKTTLAGKLGKWLGGQGHTPLLVACDLQRPNAVTQLQVVGERAGVTVFAPEPGNGVGDPVDVARRGIEEAKRAQYDIVVVDTAGRLGVDVEMMQQAIDIRDAVKPDEILFVVDAMVGQDAVNTATAFAEGVGFTGVVLTKLDGDARGGAALSVREVTGQPIMFASNGEKLEDFDVFHPDRMASRILGMGDVLTLIEAAEQAFDAEQAQTAAAKIGTGELTLEDFLGQMLAVRKMGPIANILGMLPGAGQFKDQLANFDEQQPRPDAGDHPRHDPGGARRSEDHQRLPAAAHLARFRCRGARGQRPGQPVLRGPQDDAADGRPVRHARRQHPARHQEGRQEGEEGQGARPDTAQGARRLPRFPRRPARPLADARRTQRTPARSGRSRPTAARVRPVEAELRQEQEERELVSLHLRGVLLPEGEERDLWVVNGRIRTAPVPDAETVFDGGFLLPGLVDAHCHVGLGANGAVDLDEAARQAEADRDAGTLLIRDCGSPLDTRPLQERRDLPRIVRAGRHLARPKRYIRRDRRRPRRPGAAARGRRRAGRLQSDGWVKLVGDWIDRAPGDLAPLWPDDVLVRAIDAAHDAGARVTAHVFGEDALPGLINAGIDCIEHGTGLTDDTIAEMARRGTALVPTLINTDNFPDIADLRRQIPELRQAHARAVRAVARDRGARPSRRACRSTRAPTRAAASATAASSTRSTRWPRPGSARNARSVRRPGPRGTGWAGPSVKDGAPADLIGYRADPRLDLGILRQPSRIVLRGVIHV